MNNEKFKLVLSPPSDKYGVTIKLTIDEGLHTLYIKHYPEFTWYVYGLFVTAMISFMLALIGPITLIYCLVPLVVIAYYVFNERAISCVINKKTGTINYHRSGVLMSSFNEQKIEFNISKINRLEMQQNYRRLNRGWLWGDTFQMFLLFDDGQRLPLSPSNLEFGECHDYTEKIRNFIGNEVPVKAIG